MKLDSVWIRLLIGLVTNALVLSVPITVMWCAGFAIDIFGLAIFLALASLFCFADLSREFYPADTAAPQSCWKLQRTSRLAQVTGLLVLAIFWTSLVEQTWRFAANQSTALTTRWGMIGAALLIAGAALRWQAIFALRQFFVSETLVTQNQPLVEWGPYRFIRHPSETGTLLATLGAILFFQSGVAGAVWMLGLLPLVVYRVRLEEQGLVHGLGDRYAEYQKRVRRLLPFVY